MVRLHELLQPGPLPSGPVLEFISCPMEEECLKEQLEYKGRKVFEAAGLLRKVVYSNSA